MTPEIIAELDLASTTFASVSVSGEEPFASDFALVAEHLPALVAAARGRDTAHEEGRRAGYRQGLEDAAKVAERCVSPDAHPNTIASCAASNIAAAIRAMMEGKG